MKCPNCGRELVKIRDTRGSEYKDLNSAAFKEASANDALSWDNVNAIPFKDDKEVYAYFKAAFDQKAEATFLSFIARRDLVEKIFEETGVRYNTQDITCDDLGVYVHPVDVQDNGSGIISMTQN